MDVSNIEINGTSYAVKDAKAARKGIYVGTCTTAAATAPKVATTDTFPLDGDGKPLVGTIVAIKFSNTNTYKTAGTTMTLEVNSTGAYPIYYNNAEVVSTTSANTLACGYKNRYIYYMFNGTEWVWLGYGYDANSTYSGMTVAEITAGTSTTARLITPKNLRDYFYTEDEVDALLADKADATDLPTKVSDLTNDSGFITSYTETDPTVPAWAKASTKPSYAANEISGLATVATSGSYNDLTNKPTIPSLADAKPFIIEVTSSGSEDEVTYSSQTTPLEIKSAVEAGRNIIVRYFGSYYYLTGYGAGDDYVNAVFSQSSGNGGSMDAIASSIIMESFLDGGVWSVDWYYDEREYIQPDWNVTNDSSAAFIKNKPTIPAAYDDTALAARVTTLEGQVLSMTYNSSTTTLTIS